MKGCSNFCHVPMGQLFATRENVGWSIFNAFADYNLNVTEVRKPVCDSLENTIIKGANVGYQHFLLFPQCFQKASS